MNNDSRLLATQYCQEWSQDFQRRGDMEQAGFWLAMSKAVSDESFVFDKSTLKKAREHCHQKIVAGIPRHLPQDQAKMMKTIVDEALFLEKFLSKFNVK